VGRSLSSPRDSGSVSHLTQDSACPPQFALQKRESGTPAALRPGLTAQPPLRGSISDRAHHASAPSLWSFRGSRPFGARFVPVRSAPPSEETFSRQTGHEAVTKPCRRYATRRIFPPYPALRLPTPIRATEARIGGPGCGSVLGLDIPCLRHSDSCNMFHRRNKEQSFVASPRLANRGPRLRCVLG